MMAPGRGLTRTRRRISSTRGPSDRVQDRRVGRLELAANPPGAPEVQLHVMLGMVADLVSCRGDAAREIGVALDVRPDEEERRRHPLDGERLEHAGRGARVRAVVEREVQGSRGRGPTADHAPEYRAVGMVDAERERPRGGRAEPGGERRTDHPRARSYTASVRSAIRGQAKCPALASPAWLIASRRAGSSISAIVASAQVCGSSFGTMTASAPPPTTARNPTLSDTSSGVPQAIASSRVTPNEARVVGHRYRSAVP